MSYLLVLNKVVACLVDLMQVGVGEMSFSHQVMSDDIHQDPMYHMSLCLVPIDPSSSTLLGPLRGTWLLPGASSVLRTRKRIFYRRRSNPNHPSHAYTLKFIFVLDHQ